MTASVRRQAESGAVLEGAITELLGTKCIITKTGIDVVEGKIDLSLVFKPDSRFSDPNSGELAIHGGDARLSASRITEVPPMIDLDQMIKDGTSVPLDDLSGCNPSLNVNVKDNDVIITVEVSCGIRDLPKYKRIERVLAAVEEAIMDSGLEKT